MDCWVSKDYFRLDFTVGWAEGRAQHWDVINEMVDEPTGNHNFYTDMSQDPDIRAKIFKRKIEK